MSWHPAEPVPAVVAHPVAVSLDEAYLAIDQWEFYSGKVLDSAQRLAVEHMMAEAADGLWAASSTGRAESRQNGKGDEIEVPELWGLTQRGEAILHTAHEAATAASAHARLRDLILGHRDLRSKLGRNSRGQESIQSWNGNYRIEMADGSVIVHRTRTSAIGRGLDDISRLVVDEAQHAQPEELASATPILAANPNPQKNYIGSAGVAGKSQFWWRLRKEALRGGERFAWLEHSAEVVSLNESGMVVASLGDVSDRDLWARANPAYPSRISDDFLLGQLRDLGQEHFAREHLCVWDAEAGTGDLIVPLDLWIAAGVAGTVPADPCAYAVDAAPDGRSASIAASDGERVLVTDNMPGTHWVVAALKELQAAHPGPVFLDPKGPAGALLVDLSEAGIEPVHVTAADHAQACGGLLAAVLSSKLTHAAQPQLDAAVRGATRRPYGDAWAWNRRTSSVDISPLVAVTLAKWGALTMTTSEGPLVAFR